MRYSISLMTLLLCTSGYATDATPAGHPIYNDVFDVNKPSSDAAVAALIAEAVPVAEMAATEAAVAALIAGAAAVSVPAAVEAAPTEAALAAVIAGATREATETATVAGKLGSRSWADLWREFRSLIIFTAGMLIIEAIAVALAAVFVLTASTANRAFAIAFGLVMAGMASIGALVAIERFIAMIVEKIVRAIAAAA